MKKNCLLLGCIFFMLTLSISAQNALVIIAHGAPSNEWNIPVVNLEVQVKEALAAKGNKDFSYVRVALMEFSEPSVATVVHDCEKRGIKKVFAVPLFIAPSSHSEQDIPNILNLKYSPKTIECLKEEKTKLVDSDIHITLGPTLSYGDILSDILSDKIASLSKNKANENFILVAHGDAEYLPMWKELLKKVSADIQKKTGLGCSGYGFIGMGQHFYEDVADVLQKAGKDKKTVIVQGVYLSSGIKNIADYAAKQVSQKKYMDRLPKKVNYIYSSESLLPDNRISSWIVDRAVEWLSR